LHYLRVLISHLQVISIQLRDVVVLRLSKVVECGFRLKKLIQASMDHYTVLIVPQKKSTVKKISATTTHVLWVASSVAVVIMASCYFVYSYLSFKMDYSELIALKQLSESQKEQLNSLASKVGDFERKMESLREYENRIRVMAELVKPKGQYLGVGGPTFKLKDLQANVILIEIIGVYCPYCYEQAPLFRNLSIGWRRAS